MFETLIVTSRRLLVRPKICEKCYNQIRPNQFCQLPMTTSGKKKEENWSERFLLKVYIVVCYFSLIIFSTAELISFAMRFARRELCSL